MNAISYISLQLSFNNSNSWNSSHLYDGGMGGEGFILHVICDIFLHYIHTCQIQLT